MPRMEWWDADRNRWRNPETDAEHERREGLAEGEAIGEVRAETRMGIRMLRTLLADVLRAPDLERIAADWREYGAPADAVDRIAAAQRSPREWRSLLEPHADTGDARGTDRTPPPKDR